MCGLLGMAGMIGQKEKTAFEQMLYAGALRGWHSTGVASVNIQGNPSIFKLALPAVDFLDSKKCTNLLVGSHNVLLGHNRSATRGAVSHRNAHPFENERVVGAHNGTLTGQWRLPDHKDFDVDSENIFHSIAVQGVDATYKVLDGAAALVWYDKIERTMNFLRNDERDLFYAWSKDKKTLMWASEWGMMCWIAGRNGIALENPLTIPVDTLHTFQIPFGLAANAREFEKVHLRAVSPFVDPAPYYPNGRGGHYANGRWQANNDAGGASGNVTPFPKRTTSGTATTDTIRLLSHDNGFSILNDMKEKEVVFTPIEQCKNELGVSYFNCQIEESTVATIRVYLSESTKGTFDEVSKDIIQQFKEWDTFSGTLKEIKFENQIAYGIVDRRSIVEIEDDELGGNALDGEYLGYEGVHLTREEWKTRVNCGCSWCVEVPEEDDHNTIVWLTDVYFVCEACKDLPDVTQYMQSGMKH